MGGFADRAYSNAKRLIDKYGSDIKVTQVLSSNYLPSTGKYQEGYATQAKKGHITSINNALIASGVANFDDISIKLVAPFIDKTYRIEYDGDVYNVVNVLKKIVVQNKPIIYTVQCRK